MPDDWRERWRSWLHPDSLAHPNSPAGGSGTGSSRLPGSTGYSWSPLPDPASPAGRLIHWQTELWELEQRERDEIARHVEEVERSLAKQSDKLRECIPNDFIRTVYERQVGRSRGSYLFVKSLVGTGDDATLLLQKLAGPVGWFDPQLQRKLQEGNAYTLTAGRAYAVWKFGTLQEKKELLTNIQAVVERMYEEASRSIQRQWNEAKRAGQQEELIEKWKAQILLAPVTGTGAVEDVGSAAKQSETPKDRERTARASIDVVRSPVQTSAGGKGVSALEALTDLIRSRLEDLNLLDVRCRGKVLRHQQESMSCAQATTSMIIGDLGGQSVSEEDLRKESAARGSPPGYNAVNGTMDADIPRMLNDHGVPNSGVEYNAKPADIEAGLSGGKPVQLGLVNPGHWVIVDGVRTRPDGSKVWLVRDPAFSGRSGCREIDDTELQNRFTSPQAQGAGSCIVTFP